MLEIQTITTLIVQANFAQVLTENQSINLSPVFF